MLSLRVFIVFLFIVYYIENVSAEEYYKNGSLTLDCVSSVQKLTVIWHYKPMDYDVPISLVATATPSNDNYYNQWAGRTQVSTQTGRITISLLGLADEGRYYCTCVAQALVGTCRDNKPNINIVTIIVPPTQQTVYPEGLGDNVWVHRDVDHTLTCRVDPIKPTGSVYWRIGGQTRADTVQSSGNNTDGSFWQEGNLTTNFAGLSSTVQLDCLVVEEEHPERYNFTKSYKEVEVRFRPEGASILTISTGERYNIGVNESVDFVCSHPGDSYPDPDLFTFYNNGVIQVNHTSQSLEGVIYDDVNEGGEMACVASNPVGSGVVSNNIKVTVEAFATIEEFSPGSALMPVYDDPDVYLDCLGAGNQRSVNWTKDGQQLSETDWEVITDSVEPGDYRFGQKEAYRKMYHWRMPEGTCGTVNKHTGNYQCQVQAVAGGKDTDDTRYLELIVQYPPLPTAGAYYTQIVATVGDNVTLECDVCSYPVERSYMWMFHGYIVGTKNNLTIHGVGELQYGDYSCIVNNTINEVVLIYHVHAGSGTKVGVIVGSVLLVLLLATAMAAGIIYIVDERRNANDRAPRPPPSRDEVDGRQHQQQHRQQETNEGYEDVIIGLQVQHHPQDQEEYEIEGPGSSMSSSSGPCYYNVQLNPARTYEPMGARTEGSVNIYDEIPSHYDNV